MTRPEKTAYVIEEHKRVGYHGVYCLIVPDHAAGCPNRFTVYRIPGSPSRRVRVIGRELTIGRARWVAKSSRTRLDKAKEKSR